jgi:hypothetical protein
LLDRSPGFVGSAEKVLFLDALRVASAQEAVDTAAGRPFTFSFDPIYADKHMTMVEVEGEWIEQPYYMTPSQGWIFTRTAKVAPPTVELAAEAVIDDDIPTTVAELKADVSNLEEELEKTDVVTDKNVVSESVAMKADDSKTFNVYMLTRESGEENCINVIWMPRGKGDIASHISWMLTLQSRLKALTSDGAWSIRYHGITTDVSTMNAIHGLACPTIEDSFSFFESEKEVRAQWQQEMFERADHALRDRSEALGATRK